jgi:hypothetical protein
MAGEASVAISSRCAPKRVFCFGERSMSPCSTLIAALQMPRITAIRPARATAAFACGSAQHERYLMVCVVCLLAFEGYYAIAKYREFVSNVRSDTTTIAIDLVTRTSDVFYTRSVRNWSTFVYHCGFIYPRTTTPLRGDGHSVMECNVIHNGTADISNDSLHCVPPNQYMLPLLLIMVA